MTTWCEWCGNTGVTDGYPFGSRPEVDGKTLWACTECERGRQEYAIVNGRPYEPVPATDERRTTGAGEEVVA